MPDILDRIKEKHIPWLMALVILVLYAPTLRYQYTYMDDHGLIVENFRFIGNIGNILQAFTQDAFGGQGSIYRPLLTVSFMLDAVWSGANPWGYHLTNIVLHLFCCILLYKVLKVFLKRTAIAAWLSLIFAVHPALNQAVAWIPGRNDSLLALFALSSALIFIRYIRNGKWHWLAAYLGLSLGALLTKESAVLLPLIFIPAYWSILRQRGESLVKLLVLAAGWAVIICFWVFLRGMALPANDRLPEMVFNNLPDNVNGMLGYLGKVLMPFNLAAIPVPGDTTSVYGVIAVLLLIFLFAFQGINNRRFFTLGIAWYLLFLFPYILTSSGYANYLEQRLYLPMMGLMLSIGQANVMDRIDLRKKIQLALFIAPIIVLSLLTIKHEGKFRNGEVFWEYAVKSSPSLYYAHDMQGRLFLQNGLLARAETSFRKAISLKGDYQHGYNDLGVVYLSQGRYREAEENFKRALDIPPFFRDAWMNIGTLYLELGALDRAYASFSWILENQPDDHQALNNLGIVYFRRDIPDSAVFFLEQALRLDPQNRPYQANLIAVKKAVINKKR